MLVYLQAPTPVITNANLRHSTDTALTRKPVQLCLFVSLEHSPVHAEVRGRELRLCGQMMHDGWEVERARWEEATRAAHSVQDIGNAVAYLEDWIALDYAPGSDVRSRSWLP